MGYNPSSANKEVLQDELPSIKNPSTSGVVTFGFAIHHAGISHTDCITVEDLFADGHIQVLVSTATLECLKYVLNEVGLNYLEEL